MGGAQDFFASISKGVNNSLGDLAGLVSDDAGDWFRDGAKTAGSWVEDKDSIAAKAGNFTGHAMTFVTPGGLVTLGAKGAALTTAKVAVTGRKMLSASKLMKVTKATKIAKKPPKGVKSSSVAKTTKGAASKVKGIASKTTGGIKKLSKSSLNKIKKFKQKSRIKKLKKRRVRKKGKFPKKSLMAAEALSMMSRGDNSGMGSPGGPGSGSFNGNGPNMSSGGVGVAGAADVGMVAGDSESRSGKKRVSSVANPTLKLGNQVLQDDKFDCGCDDPQQAIRRKKFRGNVTKALQSIQKSEKKQAEELDESNDKEQNAGFGDERGNFISNAMPAMQGLADAAVSKVSLWSMLGPAVAAGLFALYHWWSSGGLGAIFEWVTGFVKDAFNSLMAPFYEWWDGDITPFLDKISSSINVIVEKVGMMMPEFTKTKFNSNLSELDSNYDTKEARTQYADYQGIEQFSADGITNTSSGVLTKRIPGTDANSSHRLYTGQNNQPWMKRITSEFGNTKGRKSAHKGADFRAKVGTPIQSVSSGVVSYLNNYKHGGGKTMFVTNKDTGDRVSYLHLSKYSVDAGTEVRPGDTIAQSGKSAFVGKDTVPHIHIGIKKDGKMIDPITYINNIKNQAGDEGDMIENALNVEGGAVTTVKKTNVNIKAAAPQKDNGEFVTTEKLSKVMENVEVKIGDANRLAVEGSMQQTPTVLSAKYNYS